MTDLDFGKQKEKFLADFRANRRKYLVFGFAAIFLFLTILYLGPLEGLERFGLISQKKGQEQLARAQVSERVRMFVDHVSSWDQYTSDSSLANFFNSHYLGMLVYEPYFDSRLSWYQGITFFYKDSYAIYTDPARNPDAVTTNWILKDGSGNPCYIPWVVPYDQYAADIGNLDFRDNWINYTVNKFNNFPGYEGVFIDDVNLDISRVSCGNSSGAGNNNAPIDPRTGQVMTNDAWRRYFAEFMEQVRAAIPSKLIIHNSIWYIVPFNDSYLEREIRSANLIYMQHGFVDTGLTGGTGTYSWSRKIAFVDLVRSFGGEVIDRDETTSSALEQSYGLANYFLISNGTAYYENTYQVKPDVWWSGYETDLGLATSNRYQWNGLWRRDFNGGFVLVNPPGGATVTVDLGASFRDVYGIEYRNVTLEARQGLVFKTPQPSPTASFTSTPVSTPAPALFPSPSPVLSPLPSPSFSPTIDKTPPTVSITNPTSGSVLNRRSTVTIAADASDNVNVGVNRVEFSVNGSLICADTSSAYSCAWQVPGKPNAFYTIMARAYDAAGNNAYVSISVKSSK